MRALLLLLFLSSLEVKKDAKKVSHFQQISNWQQQKKCCKKLRLNISVDHEWSTYSAERHEVRFENGDRMMQLKTPIQPFLGRL